MPSYISQCARYMLKLTEEYITSNKIGTITSNEILLLVAKDDVLDPAFLHTIKSVVDEYMKNSYTKFGLHWRTRFYRKYKLSVKKINSHHKFAHHEVKLGIITNMLQFHLLILSGQYDIRLIINVDETAFYLLEVESRAVGYKNEYLVVKGDGDSKERTTHIPAISILGEIWDLLVVGKCTGLKPSASVWRHDYTKPLGESKLEHVAYFYEVYNKEELEKYKFEHTDAQLNLLTEVERVLKNHDFDYSQVDVFADMDEPEFLRRLSSESVGLGHVSEHLDIDFDDDVEEGDEYEVGIDYQNFLDDCADIDEFSDDDSDSDSEYQPDSDDSESDSDTQAPKSRRSTTTTGNASKKQKKNENSKKNSIIVRTDGKELTATQKIHNKIVTHRQKQCNLDLRNLLDKTYDTCVSNYEYSRVVGNCSVIEPEDIKLAITLLYCTSLLVARYIKSVAEEVRLEKEQTTPEAIPEKYGLIQTAYVCKNSSAWCREDVFIAWLFYIVLPRRTGTKNILVVLDGFPGHCTPYVKLFCLKYGIDLFYLYPNTTQFSQPLDITVNPKYKIECKTAYEKLTYDLTSLTLDNKLLTEFEKTLYVAQLGLSQITKYQIFAGFTRFLFFAHMNPTLEYSTEKENAIYVEMRYNPFTKEKRKR